MLEAVLSDLLTIPGAQVRTCVQDGLLTAAEFQQAEHEQRLQIDRGRQVEDEAALFVQACRGADLAWIIAPEFDDLLVSRTRRALEAGTRVAGSDLETIQMTADKWRLYEFLRAAGIPTIETELLNSELRTPSRYPCLIKQRFGAGGLGLERFQHRSDWQKRVPKLQEQFQESVWQPFVSGQSLSTVAIVQQGYCDLFPIGEQRINWESGFEYQGGRIPARLESEVKQQIHELLNRVCGLLPGLAGYVGFDILLPDREPRVPLIVEMNPRLTTAYTGYRRLTSDNLAERLLNLRSGLPPLRWNQGQTVEFLPDGSFECTPPGEKD